MSKIWSTLLAIGSAVLVAVTPAVHNWFVLNPVWATIIGGIGLVIAHWLPSPSLTVNQSAVTTGSVGLSAIAHALVQPKTPTGTHRIG